MGRVLGGVEAEGSTDTVVVQSPPTVMSVVDHQASQVLMADVTIEQLRTRLARLLTAAVHFRDVVYRSTTPQYATEADMLTGEGSRRAGGRWNPKGIAVVYASLTPETAMAETLAHFRYYGFPIEDAMPRTFVAIAADLAAVLDLRDGGVRQRLRVSEAAMLSLDWRREVAAGREPITHRLGRAAHEMGLEALIVPSAAHPGGSNLLVFSDRVRKAGAVALLNPGQVPSA
jgi:RES domain-containing protein